MCGLAGILNLDGAPTPLPVLERMTEVVAHRGPDGDGIWTGDGIGLGHRRLAILDPSPRGHQPMQTANGRFVLVFNGTIYNFRELRTELEAHGHVFHSDCDTEVVLEAYARWGERCVERFNGMFAIAVWDTAERRLFLARDRYGIKPLYYAQVGSTLLFGSEIKSLLRHPALRARVDVPALHEYFTFQNIFTDRTLFAGVRLLPPGHVMIAGRGEVMPPRQYWDYHFHDDPGLDEETCEREVARLFEQAVNRQLVADVDVGAYLSGGIDSASVTCLAARNIPSLRSFTCGFDLSSASGLELSADERRAAEYLSYLYKTEHYEVVLKAGDMERVMPALIWHLEDPRVGQSYPNYYVARLASRFVKVVLSGTGGDELFAGYPWRYYASTGDGGVDDYVSRHYAYWQRLVPDDRQLHLFRPHLIPPFDGRHPRAAFRGVHAHRLAEARSAEDYVNASLYFETRTFLHGLLLVEDKLSMAHGLETRVPFLDNDLVDFAMRVPVRYNLRELQARERINENLAGSKTDQYFSRTNDGKLILRRVLSRFVPPKVTEAAKQGFSAPDGSWFKGESVDYIKRLLSQRTARLYDYLQPDTVQTLLEDHFSGQTNRRLLIWSFLCFEWWLQTFDPGA
jgi:asparagine synthase (glutamine-hydrolysing)